LTRGSKPPSLFLTPFFNSICKKQFSKTIFKLSQEGPEGNPIKELLSLKKQISNFLNFKFQIFHLALCHLRFVIHTVKLVHNYNEQLGTGWICSLGWFMWLTDHLGLKNVFVITEFVITEFVITEFVMTEFVIPEFVIPEFVIPEFYCSCNLTEI